MATARRNLLRVIQLLFVVAVFVYGGHEIAGQWSLVGEHAAATPLVRLHWGYIAVASALVLATYLLLVQLWRFVLHLWAARLGLADAIRIWSVSNLGRYVPGRIAQIGVMAVMARQQGVSPVAATGSALLNTLLNIAAGILVAVAAAGRQLDVIRPGAFHVALLLLAGAAVGMVALPWLLPRAMRLAARALRRELTIPRLPATAVWLTAGGNVLAWVAYGLAFQLFAFGIAGAAAGAPAAYIAVYTGSYIVGYLVLLTPGGLGARELTMVALLQGFGLATQGEAWLLAVASRLWLTALEVLPGLLFLAYAAVRRSPLPSGDASS